MSRRSKLEKFAELLTFKNVYQNYDPKDPKLQHVGGKVVQRKGQWVTDHFGNDHPITLELACGGGEYTLALGQKHADRNYIGIDIKGNRIWNGARQALAQQLDNVCFLRTRIEQIELFFAPHEVDEIWITFPDPFVRKSKANRRLTNTNFLDKYRKFLRHNGKVHLKTDSDELYHFTQEVLSTYPHATLLHATDDLYQGDIANQDLEIKTFYERMHLEEGRKIKYVLFALDAEQFSTKGRAK